MHGPSPPLRLQAVADRSQLAKVPPKYPVEECSYSRSLASFRHKSSAARRVVGGITSTSSSSEAKGGAAGGAAGTGGQRTKLTFKDVVEMRAHKAGFDFVPNVRRGRHDGNQVYSFGNLQVFINSGVVFVEQSGAANRGVFQPVSLDELMDRARQAGR